MAIAVGVHSGAISPAFTNVTTLSTPSRNSSGSGSSFVGYLTTGSTVSSLVDNFSNVYSKVDSVSPFGQLCAIYLCDGGTGGSSHVLTLNVASASNIGLGFVEITGAANPSTDVHGTTSTPAGPSLTTTNANDLLLYMIGCNGSGTITDSGTGFSILDQFTGSAQPGLGSSTQVVSATGTYQDTFASSGMTFQGVVALAMKASAGGGVSANLTAQTATFTEGTPTPAVSYALSGQTATFTEGSPTPALASALTGQTATFSLGTITPTITYGLTGQTATFTEGSISASTGGNVTTTLGSLTATFSLGTITPTVTYPLTGQTATFTEGTPTRALSTALTGQTATFTEGTITPQTSGPVTRQLGSLTASFSLGTITAVLPVQIIRVQAVAAGWYAEIWRDIGDIFDINSVDFSSSSVSVVPPTDAAYPVFGWMKQVASTTPLYSYALASQGVSTIVQSTEQKNDPSFPATYSIRRTVI